MKENNKYDPLEDQKRLFGTIKNIGRKVSSKNRNGSSSNAYDPAYDPAYKFIKNKSRPADDDWSSKFKKNLNRNQLEVINEAKQNEQAKESDATIKKKEGKLKLKKGSSLSKKNFIKDDIKKVVRASVCPKCGAPIKEQDLFCGECGYKLEGINFSHDIEEESPKELENDKEENLEVSIDAKNIDSKEEELIINENKNKKITTKKQSHNDLPIETLEILKSFFDDQLISESEYNTLRKSALNLSNNLDSDSSNKKELTPSIKSISREKLTELKILFEKELIDKEEYDLLRRNLLFTK